MARELAAAATRYTRTVAATKNRTNLTAQRAAWDDWRITPEAQYAASWVANAMSGARLYAATRAADGTIAPLPDQHRATELVASIAGGPDGQTELLREFGVHLVVAGEGWIIIRPHDAGETWHVLSVLEVTQKGRGLEATIEGAPVPIPAHDPAAAPDPMAPAAIRVWTPSPARYLEAHSPVIGAREQLEELRLLTAAVKAIARSRITGRGVILFPQGIRFPTTPGHSGAEDDLIEVFMQVAETAIKEPESAAATVPVVLEAPAELISQIQHLTFESDFDELAIKLREEAVRRFANAAEIPAEIVLGEQGSINHWGQWSLREEAIKLGVEPRLATVAHALTTSWLRPILEDEGAPDADKVFVWYDSASLRVRSNRSQTAMELYDRGAISAVALRRETGFDDADAPAGDTSAGQPERQERPVTRLPVDETTAEPATLPASGRPDPALLAAADGLVWTALTLVGTKLRRTPACPRSRRAEANGTAPDRLHTMLPVTAEQIDQWGLLADAFARIPDVADRHGADPGCLRDALDSYVRDLITAGQEHHWDYVAAALSPCLDAA